jgi:hypothetical protein
MRLEQRYATIKDKVQKPLLQDISDYMYTYMWPMTTES